MASQNMTSKPSYIGKIISVEISQSGSHNNAGFTGYSQVFDCLHFSKLLEHVHNRSNLESFTTVNTQLPESIYANCSPALSIQISINLSTMHLSVTVE